MTTTTDTKPTADARHDGAFRGRRISWAELYRIRPDLKAENDNKKSADNADALQRTIG